MVNSVKFDRAVVIEKATQLFWAKGFHGTSMRDLLDTVDLRAGSLYASFGDKEQLFKEALNCYGQAGAEFLTQCESEQPLALDALKAFARASVLNSDNAPSRVCMLVKTMAELSGQQEDLTALARKWLQTMEERFAKLFSKAKQQGMQNSLPAGMLAKQFQVQIIGLKAYAQTNPQADVLTELTENVLAAWY